MNPLLEDLARDIARLRRLEVVNDPWDSVLERLADRAYFLLAAELPTIATLVRGGLSLNNAEQVRARLEQKIWVLLGGRTRTPWQLAAESTVNGHAPTFTIT